MQEPLFLAQSHGSDCMYSNQDISI